MVSVSWVLVRTTFPFHFILGTTKTATPCPGIIYVDAYVEGTCFVLSHINLFAWKLVRRRGAGTCNGVRPSNATR